jgi:hypothetical protein
MKIEISAVIAAKGIELLSQFQQQQKSFVTFAILVL